MTMQQRPFALAIFWTLLVSGVFGAVAQTISPAGGGGGTPGGSNTQVQFNNSGAFGGDAFFTYTKGSSGAVTISSDQTEALGLPIGGIQSHFGIRIGNGGVAAFSDGSDYGRGIAAVVGAPAVKITDGSSGPGFLEMTELTAPSAGSANTARIFTQDNGSGKTQVCAIFNTGAVQCFATQP